MKDPYTDLLDVDLEPNGKLAIVNRILRYLRSLGLQGLFKELFPEQRIIDFGCGTFNPVTLATVLYANGCKEIVCFEPEKINKEAAQNLRVLISLMRTNERGFNFSGIDDKAFRNRLDSISHDCLDSLIDSGSVVEYNLKISDGFYLTNDLGFLSARNPNFLFSNSVLEHIFELNETLELLAAFHQKNVIQFHTVDYADHRFYKLNKIEQLNNPERLFQFYEEGDNPLENNDLYGITSLRRACELESLFRSSRLSYRILETQYAPSEFITRLRLSERFSTFSPEELRVWVRAYLVY